jgi:CheY-like chemotaxis protein
VARVLIIEDERDIRNLIEQVLVDGGHEVDTAADSLTAMDKLRFQVPDLIILDLFTPRMDGWEFLNVTRGTESCRDVPVLVVTASEQLPGDRRVRAVLKKPFDLSLLTAAVESLLNTPHAELIV